MQRSASETARPALVAVDDDPKSLRKITTELHRRYDRDYRVLCERSPVVALDALTAMADAGHSVAIVLADQWMPDITGEELLTRVRRLHPDAKRGLLVDWGAWGDPKTAEVILRAMSMGNIDYYVLKPWRSPDELFHRIVGEFIHEWSRTQGSRPKELVVIAEAWAPRTNEILALLTRNGVPHSFHPTSSAEGRRILADARIEDREGPVVILVDGRVLSNPTNVELAAGYGVTTELAADRDFDVIVVGAGPSGLSAAVYASSEGLETLVVEREAIGGQAAFSSMIRNYLGFSRGVTGAELAQRAYQQAWVFGTKFVLMREAVGLRTEGEKHVVTLVDGSEARASAVVLATGVTYRRLDIPSLEPLIGAGVFYGGSVSETQALAGRQVYVVGGGNSAGQAALYVARHAAKVTIVVRGESLAATMSRYLVDEIDAASNVDVLTTTEVVDGGGDGRLEWLTIRDRVSGDEWTVAAAALFVLIGARPNTAWLPDSIVRDRWGSIFTGADIPADEHASARWPLDRAPLMFETTLAGAFAVGDVRHRSVKRVASAVGEGSVAIQQVHEYLAGTVDVSVA
jgi:thioredoxin reductase (NADPH)